MAGVVTVNGRALTDYPVTLLEGWADDVETRYSYVPLLGDIGEVQMPAPKSGPRVIRMGLLVQPATVAARGAAVDALKALFPRDRLLALSFDDDSAKVCYGKVTAGQLVGQNAATSFVYGDAIVTFTITCADPAKYDTTTSVVAFSSTATPIPVGNLPHGGVIRIIGPASTPIVIYADGAGVEVARMSFPTLSLPAVADYLEVDTTRQTIRKTVSGVTSNAMWDMLGPVFFKVDPAHVVGGAYPTLSVTGGTGTITYRRKWRN